MSVVHMERVVGELPSRSRSKRDGSVEHERAPAALPRCRCRECAAPILPRSPACSSSRHNGIRRDSMRESNERKLVPQRPRARHDSGHFGRHTNPVSDRREPCLERKRRPRTCTKCMSGKKRRSNKSRCQVHKARNIRDHLPEARRAYVAPERGTRAVARAGLSS